MFSRICLWQGCLVSKWPWAAHSMGCTSRGYTSGPYTLQGQTPCAPPLHRISPHCTASPKIPFSPQCTARPGAPPHFKLPGTTGLGLPQPCEVYHAALPHPFGCGRKSQKEGEPRNRICFFSYSKGGGGGNSSQVGPWEPQFNLLGGGGCMWLMGHQLDSPCLWNISAACACSSNSSFSQSLTFIHEFF